LLESKRFNNDIVVIEGNVVKAGDATLIVETCRHLKLSMFPFSHNAYKI
jgi:hypothetical protein